MGEKDMDIVLVRKSGPVQSMKFKPWWMYFLFLVLVLMLAGLGAGSYLLYYQQQALKAIAEDTRLLMLRAERLEALVQEQETRALLAQQSEEEAAPVPGAASPPRKSPAGEGKKAAAAPSAKPAAESKPKPQTQPQTKPAQAAIPPEPTSSDLVGVKLVKVRRQGSELKVIFDVTNRRDPANPAVGYVTVVLRAQRAGRPWIEAWPPMRLTPLGRPINYRRGTPFSVQRYRRLRANFAIGDKVFERLEFLVYSREGELLLVSRRDLTPQGEPKPGGDNG